SRQVRQPPPAFPRRRVGIHSSRATSVGQKAAGEDQLVPEGRRCHLAAWHGQGRPPLPSSRFPPGGGTGEREHAGAEQRDQAESHRSAGERTRTSKERWPQRDLNPPRLPIPPRPRAREG